MKYRSEIDGLRAVAVVPVILFHAGFALFSGGFVGVDVFFVISGYLITSLILQDMEADRFSLVHFYERRIRRIFPALFLVVAVCIPVAWVLMLPEQFKDFSQSVAAVVLFVSNFLFWQETGYFAGPSELKPLLHTWSLAVEEQYYMVFPLLLLALWRFGTRWIVAILIILALVSLASTEWGWRNARTANFFLTPFRIWELLAGALCAFWLHYREVRGNPLLGLLGIAMILVAIFTFDKTTPFPSLYTLLPVVGTCLCVLFARSGNMAGRLLSFPVFVGIGLISYSAYLWHQPLFAFARIASPVAPSPAIMLGLSVLALVLAYFSWRFVEQPFRRRDVPFLSIRRNIFALAAVSSGFLMAVGVVGHLENGFPDRLDPRVADLLTVREEWLDKRRKCHFEGVPDGHPAEDCLVRAETATPEADGIDVAMIGDSHSLALAEVVQADLKERGVTSYAVSYTGCIGLPGFYRVDDDAQHECPRHNREMLAFLKESGVKTVVLTSRFPLYLSGDRFDNGEGGLEPGDPVWIDLVEYRDERAAKDSEARRTRVKTAMTERILELAEDFNVVLIYPVPEAGWDVVRYAISETILDGGALDISTDLTAYRERNAQVLNLFDGLQHPRIQHVDPAEILCDTLVPGRCVNALGDEVYYRDEDHVSYTGARLLSPAIVDAALKAVNGDS